MIFYKCTCGLMTNELFKRCPSCGIESKKIKEEYAKVRESSGLFKTDTESLSGLFPNGKRMRD